ncbi:MULTISPECIES: flagellar hook protein [unclassified Rhizobium]|uniref:flagellar hook protein n=1 Tax=unclassified Rhizobium TaxID=2613769 RepID=UPI001ADC93D0|nr:MULTISPECIES: flagellar hook protein [unclassified Rhizobium]MBO9136713.1 flagellar hook protein [Rhizobium sp. B209b/85]MBO9172151.1 flagellar hook protein [Rhizobium sp. L245/93]MBO9186522.1 flagellar hook protein [Rhizobium sp. E27B/91]QXZ86090.1 flagellar hook protein [Rhizobium sp. K1/93]QXZ88153.1 flagellar hook protein [Rhizobium sp. K1/93]
MNNIFELDIAQLDLVSGGASSVASTVTIGADGAVSGSYTFGSKSGTFSASLPAEVVQKAGTFSFSNASGGFNFNSSFAS